MSLSECSARVMKLSRSRRRGAAIAEAIKKFGMTDPERQRGVIVRPIPDR
jgi:hypothetical protein